MDSNKVGRKLKRCINLEDRGLMTPAGRHAFENAYGWGYQVYNPNARAEKTND